MIESKLMCFLCVHLKKNKTDPRKKKKKQQKNNTTESNFKAKNRTIPPLPDIVAVEIS